LRPVLTAQPGNRDARRLLARAQIAGKDGAGALATIRPLADPPEATAGDLELAVQAAKLAGDAMAAGYAERAKSPPAQSLGRLLADGDAAMRAGNWAGAADSYKQVMAQTDGRNVVVLNNLAYAQLMLGNHTKAVDSAMKALALAPGNPSVLDTAGWALFKSGRDPEKARSLLRDAAQKAPGNLTIRAHLAEAERARS
jgi:tetratricopeptide (TPR) repeat protein